MLCCFYKLIVDYYGYMLLRVCVNGNGDNRRTNSHIRP